MYAVRAVERARRRALVRLLQLVGFLPVAVAARAADWPVRPLRIIVPAAAGGPYDRVARPIAESLSWSLGQPVRVVNRPGAGHIVGTLAGATAAPDGYTLTVTGMFNTVVQALQPRTPFDIVGSFDHIGAISAAPQWLVLPAQASVRDVQDLVRQARLAPGRIDYASSGVGSTGHLLMELLQQAAAIHCTHVPCPGGATALQLLLSGQVAAAILPPNVALAHMRAGRLRLLAVSAPDRSPLAPQVPALIELGYPDLSVVSWAGLSAPRGTDPAILQRLGMCLAQALEDPKLVSQLMSDGMIPMHASLDDYSRLVADEMRRWQRVVARLQLHVD